MKLIYAELRLSFAFNLKLRRYNTVSDCLDAAWQLPGEAGGVGALPQRRMHHLMTVGTHG